MKRVVTRTAVIKELENEAGVNFNLSEIRPTSSNVEVRDRPLRVIAWGLSDEDKVRVKIARVSSVGNPNWTLDQTSHCRAMEPDVVANVQHMDYKVDGEEVILTADQPALNINNSGVYYFEYEGSNEAVIEYFVDSAIGNS